MAASMNCMRGRAQKLFKQLYSLTYHSKQLQNVRCMCGHSPKPLNNKNKKSFEEKYVDDFYGINEVDDLSVTAYPNDSKEKAQIGIKQMSSYADVLSYLEAKDGSIKKKIVRRKGNKNTENIEKTDFGFVRFDRNKFHLPTKSKQKSENPLYNNAMRSNKTPNKELSEDTNIIDDQYFQFENREHPDLNSIEIHNLSKQQDFHIDTKNKQDDHIQSKSHYPSNDFNFIDVQYFDDATTQNTDVKSEIQENIAERSIQPPQTYEDMGYIDDVYFRSPGISDVGTVFSQAQIDFAVPENMTRDESHPEHSDVRKDFTDSYSKTLTEPYTTPFEKKRETEKDILQSGKMNAKTKDNKNKVNKVKKQVSVDESDDKKCEDLLEKSEPDSAFQLAMKIRREIKSKVSGEDQQKPQTLNYIEHERHYEGPVDSKGFRILKNQVPNFEYTPSGMIAYELKKSIIYDKDDVIAIYKPYGLPSHGGPGVRVSVGQLLPKLCQLISGKSNVEMLHLVHRLDKETTGVMLLAKTPEMAWKLKSAFQKHEVIKTYWTIVKGIPKPLEGMIDIPMAEGKVEGIHRMILRPEYTEDTKLVDKKRSGATLRAVTKYRVLDAVDDAALVECQPHTGIKHQIRVHLAYGLNTPVLGDHKYSHFTKLAPQRLFPDMLQKLGIRQSKVRHLPMHLHAKRIVIPEILDGHNLIVSCRLPRHFVTNMSRLKLKPPKNL